ncbi:hypothetical protein XENOCAPTIV_006269, partial [Xenoophorus captivus]
LRRPLDLPRSLGLEFYASVAACGWRRRQALTRSVTDRSRGEAPPSDLLLSICLVLVAVSYCHNAVSLWWTRGRQVRREQSRISERTPSLILSTYLQASAGQQTVQIQVLKTGPK